MGGRFAWSSLSDYIGRKNVYIIYLLVGAILYCLIPMSARTGSPALFIAVAAIILSMYGGGFATIPAYLKDLFGSLQVGAIHGRLLTAWSVAGVLGPVLVNYLRIWLQQRGAAGIGLYAPTMFLMAGLLIIGLLCNLAVRPVAARHLRREPAPDGTPAAGVTPPPQIPNPAHIAEKSAAAIFPMRLAAYWLVVGVPLGWGVWKTLMKLPALFQ